MTTSFVGATSAEATSLSLFAHEKGDLIVIMAAAGNISNIAIPSGWRVFSTRQASAGLAGITAFKVANSSAETSGTWTNAVLIMAGVWRHSTDVLVVNGVNNNAANATTTINFPALSTSGTTNEIMTAQNWVGAFALSADRTNDFETPPTGMINRAVISGASALELALHDTNANVASWFSTNRTASVSASYHTRMFSIEPTGYAKSSGGFRPVNIRGGADQ
jgi:hypothetical protein